MKNKLGVYIATTNQPVFLRHCLLQVLNQTRLPDVLAIHENGNAKTYRNMVEDVVSTLSERGVDVVYDHTPNFMTMPTFFVLPLQRLIEHGCDLYQKMDVDDLYYDNHLAAQEQLMEDNIHFWGDGGYDFAMNVNMGLLVLPHVGEYKHKDSVDAGIWNPTGGHPDSTIFRRNVAEDYCRELMDPANKGMNDDAIFAAHVMNKFKAKRVALTPTSCYVAHSKTVSTSHWAAHPPREVMH